MKIHPAPQGSLEWMQARAGIPTASEMDNLLTPEFKIRTGEMPKTYLATKLAEWWTGSPMPSFNASLDMEFGQILEKEAVPTWEFEKGQSVQRVGLCLTDDEKVGCSPDGLLGEDSGIEIKCLAMNTHTKLLLGGGLPKDYAVQVHGCLYVTGRPHWVFFAYRRGFPHLIVDIERNEEIQEKIGEALSEFLANMAEAQQKLIDINGGPPSRLNKVMDELKGKSSSGSLDKLVETVGQQAVNPELMKLFEQQLDAP